MKPHVEEALRHLGLSSTEAKIYLAGLSAKSLGVQELMKQTGINRTTIYHALGTLLEKGLVAKKGTGARLAFTTTKPDGLRAHLDARIRAIEGQRKELDSIMPLLMEAEAAGGTVNVLHYEGLDGVKLAIEDSLYCKSRHWDIISPIHNFFSEISRDYAKYFIATRRGREITSRSLWEPKASHADLTQEEIAERNPRILPAVMHGKFHTVICLYDEKVLIISSLRELYAIIVQSKEFHETMSALYEGLWSISKPISAKK